MIQYRPEIDGLRTIAVVAVVIYHAELFVLDRQVLGGGFLGVDIFFVISGYLITSIILRELSAGGFSFTRFYRRRVRRLLPALFTVMAAAIPFAMALMTPGQRKEFAGSVLSSILFSSNVWFWLEDSYAAEPSRLKPFLHTWTLSVEEQFYILFPIALILIWRLRRAFLLSFLILVFVASLSLAQLAATRLPDANFYLLPTRAWELMAGAILAQLAHQYGRKSHPALNATMSVAGMGMILWSLFAYSDGMAHPSFLTMLPVLGTCLVIWFAHAGEPVGDWLSTRPLVWVGLISYSLYLWHYPIFAFARIELIQFGLFTTALLIGASVALAALTYRFIETPFRDKTRTSHGVLALTLGAGALTISSACAYLYIHEGRLGAERAPLYTQAQIEAGRQARFDVYRQRCSALGWDRCEDIQPGRFNVLIVGDSHAPDALNALDVVHPEAHFILSELAGCPPSPSIRNLVRATHPNLIQCEALNEERFKPETYDGVDMVVVSYFGAWFGGEDVEAYLAFLTERLDVPVLLFGNYIAYHADMPDILNQRRTVRRLRRVERSRFAFEAENRALAARYGVVYVSKHDALCRQERCPLFIYDAPFTWDRHHLSLPFTRHLGEVIARDLAPYFPAAERDGTHNGH